MKTKERALSAGARIAALAAAGNYFVYGRNGGEHPERITGWSLQLKGEVLQRMAELSLLDQESYKELVDRTVRRYERLKKIRAYEARNITAELRHAWTRIGVTLK